MKILTLISSIIFLLFFTFSCKNSSKEKQVKPDKPDKPVIKAEPKIKWKKYTSKSGGFSILYPGKVTLTHKSIKTPKGNRVEVKFEYFKVNETLFSVQYLKRTDNKMGLYAKNELKARLMGMKKRSGGKIIRQKDILVGKFPGIEVIMESGRGKKLMRLVLTPDRFFLVITNIKQHDINMKQCRTFVDSFNLEL